MSTSSVENPFVRYLNRYTTVSSSHEAAFDEYISQDRERWTDALDACDTLRLDTATERYVHRRFGDGRRPVSVILTGNAGDGKTYLCRQIIEAFSSPVITKWGADDLDYEIEREGFTLRVVKDISEVEESKGLAILRDLETELAKDEPGTVFLIAANEGRLRAILSRGDLPNLFEFVDRQLRSGAEPRNDRLVLLNLNEVATSTFVPQVLDWVSREKHWDACEGCPAFEDCPIRFNAQRLGEARVTERMKLLYRVLEHLDIHVTIRDMLIHLAFTATAGLTCEEVIGHQDDFGWHAEERTYFENVFGESAQEAFREKSMVVRHLRALNPGDESVFRLDNFIINGADEATGVTTGEGELDASEWKSLFGKSVLDLGFKRFEQSRRAYRFGQPAADEGEERSATLIDWLPHLRRKLFFEVTSDEAALALLPFLYLEDFLALLHGTASPDQHKRGLIRGLNRAFSGLFLDEDRKLYVTSHHAQTSEQAVPIIRLSIADNGVRLRREEQPRDALDRLPHRLEVMFDMPFAGGEPIRWSLDLLLFEHLMRRAHGATPDILAQECSLSVRRLRDQLVSRFADAESGGGETIRFFTHLDGQYHARTVKIAHGNRIETGTA